MAKQQQTTQMVMYSASYKAGWPSGLRRQTQEYSLSRFWNTIVRVGSNPTPVRSFLGVAKYLMN